jgi:putative ABC transport system substrate-binding protein
LQWLGVGPLAAKATFAQSLPVIGFLNPVSPATYSFLADAFREELAAAGFVEGRNIRIEYRWAGGDYGRLPDLAAELVASGVSVIAATGDIASARAAQSATRTIPIVFTIGGDPVQHGLVTSLNRPGSNMTGVHLFSSILSAKRMELLCQIAPAVKRVAMLMNPDNLTAQAEQQQGLEAAAILGREAFIVNARSPSAIAGALAEVLRLRCDAYITASDPLILDRRGEIIGFGQAYGLAGVGFVRQFSLGGALLSYGPSIEWMYRQCGKYVAAVLNGSKPHDLPVVQPTAFDFVINMRTAAALGISPPAGLVLQATEIID